MKKFFIAAMTVGLMTASLSAISATAQTSAGGSASGSVSVTPGRASASANAGQTGALSGGTTLQAELTKTIDAKKAKSGDEVTARLMQDVKADGKVVLHKGSKLVGHVTEAQARSKENAESSLGLVFDKAVLKGGEEVPFRGVIQALAPPVQGALSVTPDDGGSTGSGMGSGSGSSMGGGRSGGAPAPVGGGAGGAVNSMPGSVSNTANNTAGSVTNSATGAVNSSVNQTAGAAASGTFSSASRGAVGMQGVVLNTAAAGNAQGSVISSANHTVKLDSGTQMILQVTGPAAAR
jgi:hypothetical protein